MRGRLKDGLLAAAVLIALATAAAGVYYWKFGRATDPAMLVGKLPEKNGTVLYLDVKALRVAQVLDSVEAKSVEEPEYKAFAAVTHFNYRTDLDAVAASFQAGEMFV